jgi:hypothetical protein
MLLILRSSARSSGWRRSDPADVIAKDDTWDVFAGVAPLHRDLFAASPAAHQMALPNRPKRACCATRRVGWPIWLLAMVLRFRCGFSSLLGSAAWS